MTAMNETLMNGETMRNDEAVKKDGTVKPGGSFSHVPVLYDEVMSALPLRPDATVLDLTCGGGGHSQGFLEQLGPDGGRLVCLDKDPVARRATRERLAPLAAERGVAFEILAGDFGDLETSLAPLGPDFRADAILADIGVSSPQLDEAERGFSFHQKGPLDMRMNPEQELTAAKLLATASEDELKRIFQLYGEERYAGRIARRIVERRAEQPFLDTEDLAEFIARSVPPQARRNKHPARRCFQALRIAVNDELGALERLLDQVLDYLAPGGTLGIISFHSLEDRIVKQRFQKWEDPCECPPQLPCVCGLKPLGEIPRRRGWTASDEELARNPRARSAKLRSFRRTDAELAPEVIARINEEGRSRDA